MPFSEIASVKLCVTMTAVTAISYYNLLLVSSDRQGGDCREVRGLPATASANNFMKCYKVGQGDHIRRKPILQHSRVINAAGHEDVLGSQSILEDK